VKWAPLKLHLAHNEPNPFNPETTIRYTLPATSHVTLSIYSVSGKLVRTLVNRTLGPGVCEATWNGTDDAGSAVPPGVYFYRLQAGSPTHVEKMTLLK